ncbi:MAG: hypothetical protein IJW64_05760 [Clostridia bacterium]|nr:hypothetical protein [Clostridia bacterium]
MALVNNGRKRPKIRKKYQPQDSVVEETVVDSVEMEETPTVEEVVETVEEVAVETPVEIEETTEEIAEEVVETVEEVEEELDEVPLEMSEDEMQVALDEEGSLDGSAEEVEELASEETVEETLEEVEEVVEVTETEDLPIEQPVEENPVVDEPSEEIVEEPIEETVEVVEQPVEEVVETAVDEPLTETAEEVVEVVEETVEVAPIENVEEKPKKDEFKLTAPANLEDILANICTKRARKLIYRPSEVIFSHTTTVLGTDKANDEKIKIKNILDAEIKQGVKLGYLDKFDGLKMSELKEEYENDIVYEYADQEFKRTGILLDGDKVKVYVYDWDMKACHHVGYINDESAELVKPYILDREKYSFDINGIIVGGKYKKIIKDEKSGKITVEKGNDGNLGLEIDINVINRKD